MSEPLLRVRFDLEKFGSLQVLDRCIFQPGKRGNIRPRWPAWSRENDPAPFVGGSHPTLGRRNCVRRARNAFLQPAAGAPPGHRAGQPGTPQIVDQLDVIHNIFWAASMLAAALSAYRTGSACTDRAKELLADFDLPDSLLREPTASLTDEQRQVIALASAFCSALQAAAAR